MQSTMESKHIIQRATEQQYTTDKYSMLNWYLCGCACAFCDDLESTMNGESI